MNLRKRVNEPYVPRFKKLNLLACRTHQILLKSDFDWAIDILEKLQVRKIMSIGGQKKSSIPPMSHETKLYLQDTFARDIENLEKLLDINLDMALRLIN